MGSTLTVWSAHRLVTRVLARRPHAEVFVVNRGATRADELLSSANHKLEEPIEAVVELLARA